MSLFRVASPGLLSADQQIVSAVAATSMVSVNSSTPGSTFASGTYTPGGSGRLVTIGMVHRDSAGAAPDATSFSGAALSSVTKIATRSLGTTGKTEIWAALSTASATTVTANFSQSQNGCIFDVVEWTGVNTGTGTLGVVQSAVGAGSTGTLTATLAAFSGAANGAYGAFGGAGSAVTKTPKAGWTELIDLSNASFLDLETQWINSNDTTPQATSSAGENWGVVAVEIAAT